MDRGTFPSDNNEAGISTNTDISGKYTTSVTVSNGELTIVYGGTDGHPEIATEDLVLSPVTSAGSVIWSCPAGSGSVLAKYRPATCR